MARKKQLSEKEIAERVADFLREDGWDIYQEVQLERHGKIADIVAVRHGIVWIVECKRTLGFGVIQQAEHWKWRTHLASVAVGSVKDTSLGRSLAYDFLTLRGIGCFVVEDYRVNVKGFAKPNRNPMKMYLKDFLNLPEEMKNYRAAG